GANLGRVVRKAEADLAGHFAAAPMISVTRERAIREQVIGKHSIAEQAVIVLIRNFRPATAISSVHRARNGNRAAKKASAENFVRAGQMNHPIAVNSNRARLHEEASSLDAKAADLATGRNLRAKNPSAQNVPLKAGAVLIVRNLRSASAAPKVETQSAHGNL